MKRSPFNPSGEAPVDERLDPAIQAELDQLDAALRGEPIQDDLLATLVRDVQATAPEMPSDLGRRLNADVAAGFGSRRLARRARPAGSATKRGSARSRPSVLLGGGLAVTMVIAFGTAFVVSQGSYPVQGGDDSMTASEPLSGEATSRESSGATPDSAPSASSGTRTPSSVSPERSRQTMSRPRPDTGMAGAGGVADAGASVRGSTPASGERKVEQSVEMRVRVKSGELDDASQKVETIVRQGGGYVADSRVSLGTRGSGNALFSLKVDSTKLDATMQRLADLGTVTRQQQASRDITSSFDSVQRRLDDNAELRKALLRALAKAETDGEIASLKRRLADNRSSRASLERQLAQLKTRADLTDIELSLRAPSGDAADEDDDGSWSIGDALSDAGKALGTVTGVLLVGGAVFLPFALLGAAGWAVYRVRRKRRRESALDG